MGHKVTLGIEIRYAHLCGISYYYAAHKIVFIYIKVWWEEIHKIFNEGTLNLKIFKLN